MNSDKNIAIEAATDGACSGNPGNGGWGGLILFADGTEIELGGAVKNTTNNRMELMAPINALKNINSKDPIEIFTDSKYVKNGITEWINTWVLNNWKTSKKENVKNKDLWLELHKLNQSLIVKWNWVKAHAGDPLNEEVDILAKKAANLN